MPGITSFSFKMENSWSSGLQYHVHLSKWMPGHMEKYAIIGSYDIPGFVKDWPSHWAMKPLDRMINKIFLNNRQLNVNERNLMQYDTEENVDALLKNLREKVVNNQLTALLSSGSATLYLYTTSSSLECEKTSLLSDLFR